MPFFLLVAIGFSSFALQISDFSNKDMTTALKDALQQSVKTSVSQLGVENGFWSNDQIKLPLPDSFKAMESTARRFGMGSYFDELQLKLNRAAEGAVAQATPILIDSLKKMTVQDAKTILTGSETAATEYFKKTSSDKLREKFLPIVKKVTTQVKLVETYDQWSNKLSKMGFNSDPVNLDTYVANKALDGLFATIAEKEKDIRKNPLEQGSQMVKKVFGSLFSK